jgi:hypothetical protein
MTDDDIPERLRAVARSVSLGDLPSGAELRARARTRRFRRRAGLGASLLVVAIAVTTVALQLPGAARPRSVTVSPGTTSKTSLPTTRTTSSPSSSPSTSPEPTTTVPAGADKCLGLRGSPIYRNPMRCGRAARLTSTLILPSEIIRVGATLHATIAIDNRTGHAIQVGGCGSPFQVLLTNGTHPGNPAWPLCLREFTIPTGHSSFKAVISARYNSCGAGSGTPRCPSKGLPALPQGRYQATTYESGHTIPVPAPRPVRVIP